jgi:hypothetical protein
MLRRVGHEDVVPGDALRHGEEDVVAGNALRHGQEDVVAGDALRHGEEDVVAGDALRHGEKDVAASPGSDGGYVCLNANACRNNAFITLTDVEPITTWSQTIPNQPYNAITIHPTCLPMLQSPRMNKLKMDTDATCQASKMPQWHDHAGLLGAVALPALCRGNADAGAIAFKSNSYQLHAYTLPLLDQRVGKEVSGPKNALQLYQNDESCKNISVAPNNSGLSPADRCPHWHTTAFVCDRCDGWMTN